MTSAWREPSGWDDRSESQGVESDERQLDLFEIMPWDGDPAAQPFAAGGDVESPFVDVYPLEGGDQALYDQEELDRRVASAARFMTADVSEDEDLRRLEESIRWLMDAGAARPQPRPVRATAASLAPLDAYEDTDDDALLLDPETLFPPRRRRSNFADFAAGAAKILIVSAVAAPTAYLVASSLQFPGTKAPTSGQAAVAAVTMPVALTRRVEAPAPAEQRFADAKFLQPERRDAPRPAPGASEAATAAVAIEPAAETKVAALTPSASVAAVTPPAAEAASPPTSVSMPVPMSMPAAAPAKPALSPDEIAMMLDKGRSLFESGDLAAARLFFRRAASAGDPAAAKAMAETYDPEVLAQHFIRGIEGDAQEAQRWYERARDKDERHIEMLAQRP